MVMKRKRGIIAQAAPEEVLDEAPADENTSPPVSDPAQERVGFAQSMIYIYIHITRQFELNSNLGRTICHYVSRSSS